MKHFPTKKVNLKSLAIYSRDGKNFVAYAECDTRKITIIGEFSDMKERS
jgi:hypothetical protein